MENKMSLFPPKGQTDKCYRTACNNKHDNCQHSQMGSFYCFKCARLINAGNPEVPNLVKVVVNRLIGKLGPDWEEKILAESFYLSCVMEYKESYDLSGYITRIEYEVI